MSTQSLAQIWSLGEVPVSVSDAEAPAQPPTPNINTWIVNHTLICRVGAYTMASILKAVPLSETRLRDEGLIPLYSFNRTMTNALKANAIDRGLTLPDIPDIPEDWSEEALTDRSALTDPLRPYLSEGARAALDWDADLLARDGGPDWVSIVAARSVSTDLTLRMVPAMTGPGGMMGGSEWRPLTDMLDSDEFKGVVGVINEEILRIRDQGVSIQDASSEGSRWDEEEAKRLSKDLLGIAMRVMAA